MELEYENSTCCFHFCKIDIFPICVYIYMCIIYMGLVHICMGMYEAKKEIFYKIKTFKYFLAEQDCFH